nr:MAG TPA: hypothetical protein [Caudoviricetes sp.]
MSSVFQKFYFTWSKFSAILNKKGRTSNGQLRAVYF